MQSLNTYDSNAEPAPPGKQVNTEGVQVLHTLLTLSCLSSRLLAATPLLAWVLADAHALGSHLWPVSSNTFCFGQLGLPKGFHVFQKGAMEGSLI
jgi:hypothetical protein